MLVAHHCRYKPAEVAADDWDTAIYGALARARELRRLCQQMRGSAGQAFLSQVAASMKQQEGMAGHSRNALLPPALAAAAAAGFVRHSDLLSIWSPVRSAGCSAHDTAAELAHMIQSLMWL